MRQNKYPNRDDAKKWETDKNNILTFQNNDVFNSQYHFTEGVPFSGNYFCICKID